MKKNFFKFSLILNISCALLSAIFMFVCAACMEKYSGQAFFVFLYYVKTFFDLLAVFVGYATIIYAFSNFDFKNGLISIGTFSVSVFISYITFIIGKCIYPAEAYTDILSSATYSEEVTFDYVLFLIVYSAGSCFITQLLPALLIALITHLITSKEQKRVITSFISWKNPTQRVMIIATLGLFAFNVLFYTFASMLPLLISENFFISYEDFINIIVNYVTTVVFYLVMQYLVYFFMHKIYHAYSISHPDKKGKV